jgi:hypothetical protein
MHTGSIAMLSRRSENTVDDGDDTRPSTPAISIHSLIGE